MRLENTENRKESACLFKRVCLAFSLLTVAFLPLHAADVYLGLQAFGGSGKPLSVGLLNFTAGSSGSESSAWAEKLRAVVREDLLFTRYFNIVEGGPALAADRLDSVAWGSLGAQVAIAGNVKLQGQNLSLECKIIDVATGKVLYGKEGSSVKEASRRLGHLLSDQLVFQLSGQPGIAHTRIAFVNNQSRNKEIYVMDYDGANVIRLTSERSIALLPQWSSDGKAIAYNSYKAQNPDAYWLEFPAVTIHSLSTRQGLNSSPHWAPDGNTLALTLSRGGDPDLFLIERNGRIVRRLTYSPGVDTSPTFSPNGQQIAFISDRSGNPELYVMDTTGASVQRLTYGQWVDAAAWSPKGDLIAYQRQRSQGQYDIYVVDPTGHNNRALTEGSKRNESPSWSPDGRFIVFSSNRNGRRQLFIMGVDGSNPHPVGNIPGESSDPTWGP